MLMAVREKKTNGNERERERNEDGELKAEDVAASKTLLKPMHFSLLCTSPLSPLYFFFFLFHFSLLGFISIFNP